MPFPDEILCFTTQITAFGLLLAPTALLGYVGLGPGPEFIPYFFALLGLVGAALIAVLQWPLSILLGYRSKLKQRRQSQPPDDAGIPPDAR